MRISQKLEYACRALAQLARRHDAQTITRLEEIAQREDVSANFLVQILNDLRRGGLIVSKRGKEGGYHLARDPKNITLRDIVEIIDPGTLVLSVSNEGESGHGVSLAWQLLAGSFQEKLTEITLDKIASPAEDTMFYI